MRVLIRQLILGFLWGASFLTCLNYGWAQEQKKFGMQSLKSTPVEKETPALIPEETPEENKVEKWVPLTPKESLVKLDDLEKWSHLDEAALANSDKEVSSLVHMIESDRGAVPPQGLFLAAKSLADKNLMEQAAVYYLTGQLRLTFDMQRWPSLPNQEDVRRKSEDNKKTSDQASPQGESSPKMDNPHTGVKNLSDAVGEPIIAWMLKDPQRMRQALERVRKWDASAPYAYLPDYALTTPIEFEKWERVLKRVREKYFEHMMRLTKAMERVKN